MQDDVPSIIKNHHVRYLNNISNPARVIDSSFVDRAFKRLVLDNVLFGTVERFDESMVLAEQALRQDFPQIDLAYIKQNIGRNNAGSPYAFLDDLTVEAKEVIWENNELDIDLYKKSDQALNNKIASMPDFEMRLADFQSRCKTVAE